MTLAAAAVAAAEADFDKARATAKACEVICPKSSGPHMPVLLGIEDDGRFAYRCGNCGKVGHGKTPASIIKFDEEEEGGPDPVRA